MSKPKKLTKAELLEVELLSAKVVHAQQKAKITAQGIENAQLTIEKLNTRINRLNQEIKIGSQELGTAAGKEKLAREEYNAFIKTLMAKYKLKESFGYDDQTGEIILPPEE